MKKVFSYIRKGSVVLLNALLPLLVSVICYQFIRFGRVTENSVMPLCTIIVITAFLSYYSLFKQGVKYDLQAKAKYFEQENQNLFTALKIAFSSKYLYIVCAVTALEFFLFEINSFAIVFNNGSTSLLSRLKIAGVCLPVFVLLGVIASVTASKDWKKDGVSNKKYTAAAYYEQAAIATVAYIMGGTVLVYISPYFLGITGILKGLGEAITVNGLITILCIIAAVILLPPLFRGIRALNKRRAFIKQLKTACSRKGYELSEIKVPFKSLFQPYTGESFTVQTDKKIYSCKLLCSLKKSVPMVLHEDGRGEHIHIISIGKKGARLEIFRYVKAFNFGYESEHDKVLIVVPVSKFMQTNRAGKIFDVDNGEVIGDYKMFAGTGFINALERECIDGAKNKNLYKYI